MKKKWIILILSGILLVSCLLIVLVNKNNKKYIMQDGMMLALTLDGKEITEFPEGTNYRVDVECENAKGKWLVEEWELVIEDITGHIACTIDFTTRKDEDKLVNVVETNTSEFTVGIPNYDTASMLSESEYGTPTMYSATSYSATSGTTVTDSFSFSNEEWSSVPGNLTSGTYYHFSSTIPEYNYYQLCYSISSGSASNRLYIYFGNIVLAQIYASTSGTTSGCVDLDEMFSGESIRVVQYAHNDGTYGISTITFSLEKPSEIDTASSGYRYNGKQPNNYIWFNNEMWRIIGSIPTCTSSECGTSENLVKIIRNDSIGALSYNTKTVNTWSSNSLYSLLNTYYYSSDSENFNANNLIECIGNGTSAYATCDYTGNGILSTSYYGKMIKNVYWNTGGIDVAATAAKAYRLETSEQTTSGYVGLMSISDYGYAVTSSHHKTLLRNYNNAKITADNWLIHNTEEWTITKIKDNTIYEFCISLGGIYTYSPIIGMAVRPVVYLDPSVYVVSGDGSITYPYEITME